MGEHKENSREGRIPGEVVEAYRQPEPREVVEVYCRPLPGATTTPVSAVPVTAKRRKRTGLWIFLSCFAMIALLAVVAVVLVQDRADFQGDPFERHYEEDWRTATSKEITIPTWPVGQGVELPVLREHGESLTAQEVYRRVNPAVVTVGAQLGDQTSMGTGVIFTSDGYILTNYHVVAGGEACVIVLDTGYRYEAKYVAGDVENDLAVLKVDATGLPAAEFGDSDLLTVGDPVYAIGNPLGYEFWGTLTDGIVSAVDREVEVDGRYMTLIQTNAALNSGNSGGPLINQYGQVVGINVIKMSSDYSNIEGLGFAIPSAVMNRVVNDLLTFGEAKPEPLLGISVQQIGVRLTEELWGLEVVSVTADSVAEKAGVRIGDYIVAADGEPMRTSKDLLRIRRQHYVGEEMFVTLWRNGALLEAVLELENSADGVSDAADDRAVQE